MRIILLIALLFTSVSVSYADEISAGGGGGSGPMMSAPVAGPGGPSISIPTVDFTLVKKLPFSIFNIKL